MKKSKKGLLWRIRIGILLLLGGIILRRPFLWVMRLFPRSFDYMFFVYPGKESDMDGYLPRFFTNEWCRTQLFFGGIITAPKGENCGRGILVGAPSTVRSMVRSDAECRVLQRRMKKISHSFSIKRVAIAGRAPSIFLRHGISLDNPFVHGEKGMVFCTIETLYSVAHKHGLSLEKANIAVFGAGRVGKSISAFLSEEGYAVKSIRSRSVFDEKDSKLSDSISEVLKTADIVIVISAKGSDFHPYMKYLKDNAFVISETHPPIQRPFKRGTIHRAALSMEGLQFVPSLETYSATSIPGCVIEAIVFSKHGEITDQVLFNEKAREIGFRAGNVE